MSHAKNLDKSQSQKTNNSSPTLIGNQQKLKDLNKPVSQIFATDDTANATTLKAWAKERGSLKNGFSPINAVNLIESVQKRRNVFVNGKKYEILSTILILQ
jgi:hypothetical protein